MHLPNYSVLSPDSDEESLPIIRLELQIIGIEENIRICTIWMGIYDNYCAPI